MGKWYHRWFRSKKTKKSTLLLPLDWVYITEKLQIIPDYVPEGIYLDICDYILRIYKSRTLTEQKQNIIALSKRIPVWMNYIEVRQKNDDDEEYLI